MSEGEGHVDWEAQQKRTFTTWANERLRAQTLVPDLPELDDITQELENGVHLVCLMHSLFPQNSANLRSFKAKPRNAFEKKINIQYALELALSDGVKAPLTKVEHFSQVCFLFFPPPVNSFFVHFLCAYLGSVR